MREVRLGDVIERVSRPIVVDAERGYHEIGIRSHGKGIFHKEPTPGDRLGNKRIFEIRSGDLVFNIVFAWEGAVAVAGATDDGRCGSHRFPTYRPIADACDVRYLAELFHTEHGLRILRLASPGSAGRNRTLNQSRLMDFAITLPSIADQRRIVDLLSAIDLAIQSVSVLVSATQAVVTRTRSLMSSVGELVPLGELASIESSLVSPTSADFADLPHIGIERIESRTGRLLPLQSAAEDGVTSGKYLVTAEDIVYSKIRPELRKAAFPRMLCLASADAYPLRPKTGVNPEFLFELLLSDEFSAHAIQRSGRTKMPKVNRSELFSIPVRSCSPVEQAEFASLLSGLRRLHNGIENESSALTALRAALLHDLLSGNHEIPESYDALLEPVSA